MSSVQSLRQFISERLTAAAGEIFTEFEKTIVQYEEEIDRQRRLLDISSKPQINLYNIELPQRYACKEEEPHPPEGEPHPPEGEPHPPEGEQRPPEKSEDEQEPEYLQIKEEQEEPPSPEEEPEPPEEEPDPPLLKEEQEELCISPDEEQQVLKQEAGTFMVTVDFEEGEHWEPEPDWDQLLPQNSPEAENQEQKGGWTENPGLSREATRDHRDEMDGGGGSAALQPGEELQFGPGGSRTFTGEGGTGGTLYQSG
ncbi:cilia- and flagella-associated protein 251-like [Kryptolebias marmoratus]|uniref:cilia- and flagella-associated protein 251-like n=1 Tax=Kryptolebias marmoratus TaxID=37003 RepID=UPI0018ACB70E|nr:cilia- and flagella-associated protein 251-like [Kryptolebias marmoratus]